MLGVSPWLKAPVAPSPANCCSGTGHAIVDKVLAQEAVQRNVALQLPSFLGVARIVAETEMIAIVPHRYGAAMAGREKIRMPAVPVTLPSFSVKRHWHERYHADASNRWLRQVMAQLFAEGTVGAM
jgi:DNA-binding transcriptional LysR family regulator